MFCERCGREIPGNAKFCKYCGQEVGEEIIEDVQEEISEKVKNEVKAENSEKETLEKKTLL